MTITLLRLLSKRVTVSKVGWGCGGGVGTEVVRVRSCHRIHLNNQPCIKFHPRTGHEGPEGGGYIYSSTLFNLGVRWGWAVNTTPRPLYPRERPGTDCIGGWMGPKAGLDGCEKSRPHQDSIPGPSKLFITIPEQVIDTDPSTFRNSKTNWSFQGKEVGSLPSW
jgi:hypothetical protein